MILGQFPGIFKAKLSQKVLKFYFKKFWEARITTAKNACHFER